MTNPLTSSAARFRVVLTTALFTSILVIVAIVVYGVRQLDSFAAEVNQQVVATAASEGKLNVIRSEATQLESHQEAVRRAKQIIAESQEYQYQDVIIQDIEHFAELAGVSVLSYDFTTKSDDDAATSGDDGSTESPKASPGAKRPNDTAQSQLRSTVVNISLTSPVNYRNFLKFLNHIEQNLTKMQVASVSLSSADHASQVNTDSLQIEVYIR